MPSLWAGPVFREGADTARGLLVGGGLFLFLGLFFGFLGKQWRYRLTESTPGPGENVFGWERQREFARMVPLFRGMKYLGLGLLVVAGAIVFIRWVS